MYNESVHRWQVRTSYVAIRQPAEPYSPICYVMRQLDEECVFVCACTYNRARNSSSVVIVPKVSRTRLNKVVEKRKKQKKNRVKYARPRRKAETSFWTLFYIFGDLFKSSFFFLRTTEPICLPRWIFRLKIETKGGKIRTRALNPETCTCNSINIINERSLREKEAPKTGVSPKKGPN